jgi:hypothetical protein
LIKTSFEPTQLSFYKPSSSCQLSRRYADFINVSTTRSFAGKAALEQHHAKLDATATASLQRSIEHGTSS